MSSRTSAKVAFASAVVLLLFCGVAAMIAISRYSNSAEWVNHTYEVTVATGRVESTLSEAARARLSYITGGDPSFLQQYEAAKKKVSEGLCPSGNLPSITLCNRTTSIAWTTWQTNGSRSCNLL